MKNLILILSLIYALSVLYSDWFLNEAVTASFTGDAVTISSTFFKNEAVTGTYPTHRHKAGEWNNSPAGFKMYDTSNVLTLVANSMNTQSGTGATVLIEAWNTFGAWASVYTAIDGGGSITMDSSDDNKSEWAATGNYTPSGSVTMNSTDDNKIEWAASGSYDARPRTIRMKYIMKICDY